MRGSSLLRKACANIVALSFGVPATLLETIPIANVFFAFTNTVGAALWAADLEKHGSATASGAGSTTTAPNLRNQAQRAQQ